ncbi:MAG: hypothetical protein ABEJ99_01080 [Candidatus Nanohaloarchaea archaeon]
MANIRFCPNCGSTDVEPDTEHTNQLGEMIFNQNKWVCHDCEYRGIMPHLSEKDSSDKQPESLLQPESDAEDFDKEFSEEVTFTPKEQEKIDTDAGRGYARYIIYIAIPAVLIYALIIMLLH